MKGEHRPGYRRPRTGEERSVRQPLKIDKLSQEVRDAILKARAEGCTWEETAEWASKKAGEPLAISVVHRWYDLRVEQVRKEVMEQAERSRAIAAAFAGKEFKDLPEAALNALTSEVFAVMEAGEAADREKALANLVFVMSKLITAQAKQKQVELEREKIELAKKKFDDLRSKAEKATNDAAAKIGKGKEFTLADINNIRQRTFGLPPIQRSASAGH
ncbi:MAG: DUF3486 family protein [Acidobacteriia bacterium]|nr:DUF3486 family protein [Terriglobia bacterium]